jgi:hypothetical protein
LMQSRQERLLAALSPDERIGVFSIVDKLMAAVEADLGGDVKP